MSSFRLLLGDCRASLASLPDASVQTCVTSPPYWGLRDYGHAGQLGLEPTPEQYVANMVDVFREVRRVLRDDGTLFLNLGDSYAGSGKGGNPDAGTKQGTNAGSQTVGVLYGREQPDAHAERERKAQRFAAERASGIKPKDLVGIPWMVAFALRADGWYLRSDIIWAKPNPMPESVTDRPTKAHEYVFLLSKSERYFYDADAIAEPVSESSIERWSQDIANQVGSDRVPGKTNGRMKAVGRKNPSAQGLAAGPGSGENTFGFGDTRNARTVWSIATQPFKGAHFATFPPELAERCILAGSKPGDTVLDPFAGSGTTGMVATGHGRDAILCELNPEYAHLIRDRIGPLMEAA